MSTGTEDPTSRPRTSRRATSPCSWVGRPPSRGREWPRRDFKAAKRAVRREGGGRLSIRPAAPTTPSRWFIAGGLSISLFAVLAGFAILLGYSGERGSAGHVPELCPESAATLLDGSRPTLLLFAHPQCPCTRATMSELDRIAARCAGRMRIVVSFLSEPELGQEALHGQLWTMASRIPGAVLREDESGALARTIGVETSGHVVLYAPDGHLIFEGGITSARGHEGDSAGKSSILEAVLGGTPTCASTPVFGCALSGGTVEEEKSIAP